MKPHLAGVAADRPVSATAAPESSHDRAQESEDEADQLDSREIEQ